MDLAFDCIAWSGLALSAALVVLGSGNAVIFAVLWVLYHSLVNIGQRWCVCVWVGGGGGGGGGGCGCGCVWVHWWLSGIHSELPIERLVVQSQPVVIWCSVFL